MGEFPLVVVEGSHRFQPHLSIISPISLHIHSWNTPKWKQFNLITTDTDSLREDLRFWKAQAISSPQPLFIDIFLDLSQFDHQSHVLLIKTPQGYQRVANEALMKSSNSAKKSILLETWRLTTTVLDSLFTLRIGLTLLGILRMWAYQTRPYHTSTRSMWYSSGRFIHIHEVFLLFIWARDWKDQVRLVKFPLWSNHSVEVQSLKLGYRLSTSKISPSHEISFAEQLIQSSSSPLIDPRTTISEYSFGSIPNPYG